MHKSHILHSISLCSYIKYNPTSSSVKLFFSLNPCLNVFWTFATQTCPQSFHREAIKPQSRTFTYCLNFLFGLRTIKLCYMSLSRDCVQHPSLLLPCLVTSCGGQVNILGTEASQVWNSKLKEQQQHQSLSGHKGFWLTIPHNFMIFLKNAQALSDTWAYCFKEHSSFVFFSCLVKLHWHWRGMEDKKWWKNVKKRQQNLWRATWTHAILRDITDAGVHSFYITSLPTIILHNNQVYQPVSSFVYKQHIK